MMFAFSRDGAVPGHTATGGASPTQSRARSTPSSRSASSLAILMIPAIWNYLVGYAVGTAIAVIGLYIAFVLPVFLRSGSATASSTARGASGGTTSGSTRRARLGRLHRDPLQPAALQGGPPVGRRLLVVADELHGALVRRHRPLLRRLVGALGQELVQRPGADGHRGGARAARGAAGEAQASTFLVLEECARRPSSRSHSSPRGPAPRLAPSSLPAHVRLGLAAICARFVWPTP